MRRQFQTLVQRDALRITLSLCMLGLPTGCAHSPPTTLPSYYTPPQVHGSYYQVQPGETLWSIAQDFGWDVQSLAAVNHVPDPKQVKAGQRLFIPAPKESKRFLWPARGKLSRARGSPGNTTHQGLEITAPEGSLVRASRTGRVAVAARQLVRQGKTVILDHGDGYLTIYCGLEQLLVSPGRQVRQGNPIGQLGQVPLYFEIRFGTHLLDPLRMLP